MRVELIALRSIREGGTYFRAPALEFSTLLEVTEAGTLGYPCELYKAY